MGAAISRRDFKVYYIPPQQAAAITGAGAPPVAHERFLFHESNVGSDNRSHPVRPSNSARASASAVGWRQVGPLMAGLLIAGRVGSAIGAELAVLRLTEQIDAFESLAIDSFRHLVITRVAACVIALPILTLLMCFAEIAGGFLWEATHSEMSLSLYVGRVFDRTGWSDYILPTLMTTAAGFAIGTVACYLGYSVEENAVGVRRASMHSVVLSCLFVIALNLMVNQMMSLWFPVATP
jgi:ABC transport permease subunit